MDNKGIIMIGAMLTAILAIGMFAVMFFISMTFITPFIMKLFHLSTSIAFWDILFNPEKVFMFLGLSAVIAAVMTGIIISFMMGK